MWGLDKFVGWEVINEVGLPRYVEKLAASCCIFLRYYYWSRWLDDLLKVSRGIRMLEIISESRTATSNVMGGKRIWLMYTLRQTLEMTVSTIKSSLSAGMTWQPQVLYSLISSPAVQDSVGSMNLLRQLAFTALLELVYGHGYLTIPSSRTRLGHEACGQLYFVYLNTDLFLGIYRYLPRMYYPWACHRLAWFDCSPSWTQWSMWLQCQSLSRLQPTEYQLGHRRRCNLYGGRCDWRTMVCWSKRR